MRAKYVMTDKGPILFPESFRHDEFKRFRPTSAGFVGLGSPVITFGKSESLKMEPNSADGCLIEVAFDILPF